MAHGTFALSLRCTGLSFRRVARAPRLFVSTCMSCGNEQSVPCAFLWSSSSGTRASAASPPARQNAKGMWASSRVKVEIRDVPREDGVSLLFAMLHVQGVFTSHIRRIQTTVTPDTVRRAAPLARDRRTARSLSPLANYTPHVLRGRDANPRTPTASNALRRR